MKIVKQDTNIELHGVLNFVLSETLDCGQAFRWQETEDGLWQGVAFGRFLKIGSKNGVITLYNTSEDDFNLIWKDYFDLDRDYGKILSVLSQNDVLKTAGEFASGIGILRQEPWEALCSFIISQNNNIPRIKGIIDRLCENFGEKIAEGVYSFPTAEKIASLSLDDLAVLRSGFRAKYILDAAKKVASKEIVLEALRELALDDARAELVKIYGVGEKVAEWGADFMGDEYSYVGAVVGATYPEVGKIMRKVMPKTYILVPGYGAQGGKGKDLAHFFNEDGLGAIINSSRGIIAAYQQEAYAKFGAENFADASRQAVIDMREDIASALASK